MSNAKGGDDDSPRKHSDAVHGFGHADSHINITSRVRVFMANGVWKEGGASRPKRNIRPYFSFAEKSYFPLSLSAKMPSYPSFSPSSGTKLQFARGEREFELAGNHSGSSVLSVGGPTRASGQIPSYQTLDRV